ncbi:class I tRNA ligase family protein [Stratiformator vulcanicus]|uniref:Isoleucine--tRNA ligase n=1 Tax=Stratiformator vulcanicus TaxID=2527980 RepID=A0A517R0X1_9PLAN|nr:class I tRNA ligase family protein [Stratiformator vulcanicus]QDT37484.1 Isoleucine--tRNA ligase [Stratiformator vulcanicus]
MFQKVTDARFLAGEHEVLKFWTEKDIFAKLRRQNAGGPKWSFLDGPITANNPMGVHHAWGRTYKDAYQRFHAMRGAELRYQNGFDCQGLWVEVEVQKEFNLQTKDDIREFGVDRFVHECKKRVLRFAARQTEQSIRLGYWMDWDAPATLRKLADHIGTDDELTVTTPSGKEATGTAEEIVAKLGNPEWGGSYFTFSTENNETIWTFLKKCYDRGKVYRGYDVMPWGGRTGSAYSQMEVNDGRRLTTHRAVFVRFPILRDEAVSSQPSAISQEKAADDATSPLSLGRGAGGEGNTAAPAQHRRSESESAVSERASDGETDSKGPRSPSSALRAPSPQGESAQPTFGPAAAQEYLLVWTTTPWTLTSNVAAAINPDLDYIKVRAKRDGAVYYFAKDNLHHQRLASEFKDGFGRPEWKWPKGVAKLKTLAQMFKEQGGFEELDTVKGADLIGLRYRGPFDELEAQNEQKEKPGLSYWRGGKQAFYDFVEAVEGKHPLQQSQIRALIAETSGLLEVVGSFSNSLLNLVAFDFAFFEWEKQADQPTLQESASNFDRLHKGLRGGEYRSDIDSLAMLIEEARAGNSEIWPIVERFVAILREVIVCLEKNESASGVECHRVINGGRDNKGNPIVTAGEGTGIVHTAPGCGDVDHTLGEENGLVAIAPLDEQARFIDGFGEFTGRDATDPETADLVIERLKEKGFHFADEVYPHIYPHCWRTGTELIFRLVDEWFINMDWRDEIKDVVQEIEWLPESIQGKERETEWLTNMRDWMVSKKRFWGLALPIWINPDDPTDFEVMGSLGELKDRAVEGWDVLEGHTPHKPWIDAVKIKSEKTGAILERVPDVGNPWLDAGITPFSTMGYNHNREMWEQWYPADFVTECFPGQFRNWFYSLLSLSTMMRHDETEDPKEKRPFKTLLGHRLVTDEFGRPMHKSDGTAIWFEEAAEQLGVDTLRWMYLSQNPANDLRFGLRHPKKSVELKTPDGLIKETKDGFETCLVTSTPADETRRQILIPLWNSYAFFVNYARLDGFDPSAKKLPHADLTEGDRWILSELQHLIRRSTEAYEAYDAQAACDAAAFFIDDLSNWYIRRNRRRFWRGADGADTDKLAAYQTLHHVLVELSKVLAPALPFLAERMYRNLVTSWDDSAPESVHLCRFPSPDESLEDEALRFSAATAQRVVRLGHRLREQAEQRVRQPLAELRYSATDKEADAIEALKDVIADELNIKELNRAESLDELVQYTFKPNLKTLGPKYGKLLGVIRKELPNLDPALLAPLRAKLPVALTLAGHELNLEPDDVLVGTEQSTDWVAGDDGDLQIALSTHLTPELTREGIARDFVRQVQQMRKDAGLEIEDRIKIQVQSDEKTVQKALAEWGDYIRGETLADAIEDAASDDMKSVNVGDAKARLAVVKSGK